VEKKRIIIVCICGVVLISTVLGFIKNSQSEDCTIEKIYSADQDSVLCGVTGENNEKTENGKSGSKNTVITLENVNKVALTFDDGPSTVYTKILLDGLKERGVKATFFLTGQEIQYSRKIVKRMSDEGHVIGNHTYSHIDLKKTDFNTAKKEIEKTNRCIKKITGKKPKYIRPPYGDWDDRLLKETEMSIVLWSVDPEDWKDQNATIVARRVIKNTRPGDIILLHDIFKTSVEAAFSIIDSLKSKGYEFVTIDNLNSAKIISSQ
jgi:peptidoglycan/xylan/chitin deacetylase (PgdA/CDA1 family)